jgi:hypothetical protein
MNNSVDHVPVDSVNHTQILNYFLHGWIKTHWWNPGDWICIQKLAVALDFEGYYFYLN